MKEQIEGVDHPRTYFDHRQHRKGLKMEIKIDPEFRDLIPSPTAEELANLEESLKADGCRDALMCWDDTLIDGHKRYEICTRLEIPFKHVNRTFGT